MSWFRVLLKATDERVVGVSRLELAVLGRGERQLQQVAKSAVRNLLHALQRRFTVALLR